jgi:hypothetical protein
MQFSINKKNLLIKMNRFIRIPGFKNFKEIAGKAGFKRFELLPLAGPTSAAIAYK